MKAVIIEDEPLAARMLGAIICELDPAIEIAALLRSIEESVEWFRTSPCPDLVFCDIHLGDGLSFSIFAQIGLQCPVIFTTAYDKYVLQAFRVNCIDYLVKPFTEDDIRQALDKAVALRQHNITMLWREVAALYGRGDQHKPYPTKMVSKLGNTIKIISLESVAYFFIEAGITFAMTTEGRKWVIDQTLEGLEELLAPELFFRANRQLLLHSRAIMEINIQRDSRYRLVLLPAPPCDEHVSSRRTAAFQRWLNG